LDAVFRSSVAMVAGLPDIACAVPVAADFAAEPVAFAAPIVALPAVPAACTTVEPADFAAWPVAAAVAFAACAVLCASDWVVPDAVSAACAATETVDASASTVSIMVKRFIGWISSYGHSGCCAGQRVPGRLPPGERPVG